MQSRNDGAPAGGGSPPPLTARSVLASALLGEDPPELPVAHLVRLAGLFGISDNRARVALTRMVAAGEATTDGAGRYRLAGHLLARRRRQQASLAGDRTGGRPWAGRWLMAVVRAGAAAPAVRAGRRRALAAARLAERRDGVWLRPDNLDVDLPEAVARDVERFVVRPEGDAGALAAGLWDLGGWAAAADGLRAALAAERPDVPDRLADGFVLSAAVLRHLQSDPLLPPELLPTAWPGRALRDEYRRFDAAYRRTLVAWGRGVATAPTTV